MAEQVNCTFLELIDKPVVFKLSMCVCVYIYISVSYTHLDVYKRQPDIRDIRIQFMGILTYNK